jgi:hypothetical protein
MAAIDNGDRIRSERLPTADMPWRPELSEADLAGVETKEPSVPESMIRSMEVQQKILNDKAMSYEKKIAHYKQLLGEAKLGLSAIEASFKVLKANLPKSEDGK